MKATAIPTVCYAIASASALVFYAGFSRLYGDQLLGAAILISSTMSILQIAVVPQAWAYILASPSQAELVKRFSAGVMAEVAGGLAGLCVVLVVSVLPIPIIRQYSTDALLIYCSLWVAGSTSTQGYFRAQERWAWFATWVLLPNALRVSLLFLLPWASRADFVDGTLVFDAHLLFFVYFLLPELVGRVIVTNTPLLIRHFRLLSVHEFVTGLRHIGHNWLFDIGSALTETADKVVVGALLGPQLLVPYFFGRKEAQSRQCLLNLITLNSIGDWPQPNMVTGAGK